MESTYTPRLQKVLALQESIRDLHPFLEKVFPIALVKDDQFWIYDLAPSSREYIFVGQAPTPMPIRRQLEGMLSDEDYEYMVWQEWIV